MSETPVDVTKVKGSALKDPTVTASLPISVENPALAYDSGTDRFKMDLKAVGGTAQTARDWSSDLAKLQNLPTDPAKESGKLTDIDATLTDSKTVLDALEALLAGGLPAAIGGAGGLKTEEQNWPATYIVEATDLDIRDLTATERTPLGSQTQPLQQKAVSYDLIVTLDSETVTVQATDLDIRDLTETERTPLGSGGVALQQVAGDNALRIREQAFPADYPDAATLALLTTKLAGGLPSVLTADKLKVRATEIETLLAGGLPAALGGAGGLKVEEQSPLTEIEVSNFPADYPDSAVATLLAGGLPAALGGGGGLKVEEQTPITSLDVDNFPADYPDSAVATLLAGGLPAALDNAALKTREQNWPTVLQTATAIGTLGDVTAAASATRLTADSTSCKTVTVKALAANTGKVRVGDSNVTASRGHELSKDQAVDIVVNNVNLVYVFGNATDKVSVMYVN